MKENRGLALRSEATDGFTLTELLVTTSIILLFSAIIFPNFNLGEKNLALERSSVKLAQDLGRAREMAMSGKEFAGAPPTFKGAYGVKLERNASDYILFADLDDDQIFDPNEAVETILLEKNIRISAVINYHEGGGGGIEPVIVTVTFLPPDPKINMIDDAIIVTLNNGSRTKNIKVNKAGLINVE